jgi:hypothetical protein
MSAERYALRRLLQKMESSTRTNGRLWAIVALLAQILLTAYFDRRVKSVEHRLALELERTKAVLSADLERTKVLAASRIDRGDNFYKTRLDVYEKLWADAVVIPSLARQVAVDRTELTRMTEVLDRLNNTYRTRALYLGESTRMVVDQLYAAGFRAAGGHGDAEKLEQQLRTLQTQMQDDLQLLEIEKVAKLSEIDNIQATK